MAKDTFVRDIGLAGYGPQGTGHRRDRDAGPHGRLRAEYGATKPLTGARIVASLHIRRSRPRRPDRDADGAGRADVRWASCNIFSTQDHRGGGHRRRRAFPVFGDQGPGRWRSNWDLSRQVIHVPGRRENDPRTMAGTPTSYVLRGARAEAGEDIIPVPQSEEEERDQESRSAQARRWPESPGWVHRKDPANRTSGACRRRAHHGTREPALSRWCAAGLLAPPRESTVTRTAWTKSKSTTSTAARKSLVDGIRRATRQQMDRPARVAVVCGYRRTVGKGSGRHFAQRCGRPGQGDRRSDPICALQAAMDGTGWCAGGRGVGPRTSSSPTNGSTRTSSGSSRCAKMKGHGDSSANRPFRQRDPGRRAEEPQVDEQSRNRWT